MFLELEPVFNNVGQSLPFEYDLDLSSLEAGNVNPVITPVSVKGCVSNRAGVVSIAYTVDYTYSAPCDRCAEPTEKHVSFDESHVLVTSLNNEDSDDLILIDGFRFNADELVREDVILRMPQVFLCREDCKGLCPYCGQNLNESSCGCKPPVDPRMEIGRAHV